MDLYHSCLDIDEIVKLGSTPLLMLINETGNAHIYSFSQDVYIMMEVLPHNSKISHCGCYLWYVIAEEIGITILVEMCDDTIIK